MRCVSYYSLISSIYTQVELELRVRFGAIELRIRTDRFDRVDCVSSIVVGEGRCLMREPGLLAYELVLLCVARKSRSNILEHMPTQNLY